MTTIILVIIGILLAGAAAIFVVFYGGEAFGTGSDKAEAARLINEGVMIQSAVQAFRVQEQRMPGNDDSGVDAAALWDLSCPNSDGHKYLAQIPKGMRETPPTFNCNERPAKNSTLESPWKIDYTFGIARSIVGEAYVDKDTNKPSKAYAICVAARKSIGREGTPPRCETLGGDINEPCCIMSADDAAA